MGYIPRRGEDRAEAFSQEPRCNVDSRSRSSWRHEYRTRASPDPKHQLAQLPRRRLHHQDYKFASGETLPQLRLHYRTLGSAERNAAGQIVNGVLLLQGNTGTGANWLRPTLADELFKDGEPLDASRYCESTAISATSR
jgi:homoserine acetyltransferase